MGAKTNISVPWHDPWQMYSLGGPRAGYSKPLLPSPNGGKSINTKKKDWTVKELLGKWPSYPLLNPQLATRLIPGYVKHPGFSKLLADGVCSRTYTCKLPSTAHLSLSHTQRFRGASCFYFYFVYAEKSPFPWYIQREIVTSLLQLIIGINFMSHKNTSPPVKTSTSPHAWGLTNSSENGAA